MRNSDALESWSSRLKKRVLTCRDRERERDLSRVDEVTTDQVNEMEGREHDAMDPYGYEGGVSTLEHIARKGFGRLGIFKF